MAVQPWELTDEEIGWIKADIHHMPHDDVMAMRKCMEDRLLAAAARKALWYLTQRAVASPIFNREDDIGDMAHVFQVRLSSFLKQAGIAPWEEA